VRNDSLIVFGKKFAGEKESSKHRLLDSNIFFFFFEKEMCNENTDWLFQTHSLLAQSTLLLKPSVTTFTHI
jgi:hypothetical protein